MGCLWQFLGFLHFRSKFTSFLRQKLDSFSIDCPGLRLIYPYDKVCIVCEKPIVLSVDSNHRLHAEGKPAVQFADGVSVYAYHGVILPEWYGRVTRPAAV